MPEIRHNIITREWVIIATDRAEHPEEFASVNVRRAAPASRVESCPFCPGNEAKTPPGVLAGRTGRRMAGARGAQQIRRARFLGRTDAHS